MILFNIYIHFGNQTEMMGPDTPVCDYMFWSNILLRANAICPQYRQNYIKDK